MKNILIKISSIIFLGVFLFNLAGYLLVFKSFQYLIRREIKQQIKMSVPEDQLEKITFSKNEKILWVKADKEFIYKENMYDVVRTEQTKDKIIFYCIHDFKETKLFAGIDNVVKSQMNGNSKRTRQINILLKQIVKDYYSPSLDNSFELGESVIQWFRQNSNIKYIYSEVKTPPPQFSIA